MATTNAKAYLRALDIWIFAVISGSRIGSSTPPGSAASNSNSSLTLLNLRDCVAAVGAFGLELDLVADLDLLEHRRILHAVDHGHTLIHAEALGRTMLERDLSGAFIDLLDLAVDRRVLRHCGSCKQGCDQRYSCRALEFVHGVLLIVGSHFTAKLPIS